MNGYYVRPPEERRILNGAWQVGYVIDRGEILTTVTCVVLLPTGWHSLRSYPWRESGEIRWRTACRPRNIARAIVYRTHHEAWTAFHGGHR